MGFITPQQVQWKYDDSDKSVSARYARAIAAYKSNSVAEALLEIDELITQEPSNPYFQELKGQMLVDFGRVKEALPYYRKAVEKQPLLRFAAHGLGHALIESVMVLKPCVKAYKILNAPFRTSHVRRAHRLLATAYGQLGQENIAKLHLAEEAVLQRRLEDAKAHATAVLETSPKDSRDAIHAGTFLRKSRISRRTRIPDE